MRIGGLQKFSIIDYPRKLACVLFTQGCNFRCRYCYNPELVLPDRYGPVIPVEEVFEFLESRKQYLRGVVVSGGEPTIQGDLVPFLDRIKRMGYLIKLDTNGSRPDVLRKLIQLQLVNYIAMDVKAPLKKYRDIVDVSFDTDKIKESIELITSSGIMHHFRTTFVKSLCTCEDLSEITDLIEGSPYYLQKGQLDKKILDEALAL